LRLVHRADLPPLGWFCDDDRARCDHARKS
jgi:hypothetical protein